MRRRRRVRATTPQANRTYVRCGEDALHYGQWMRERQNGTTDVGGCCFLRRLTWSKPRMLLAGSNVRLPRWAGSTCPSARDRRGRVRQLRARLPTVESGSWTECKMDQHPVQRVISIRRCSCSGIPGSHTPIASAVAPRMSWLTKPTKANPRTRSRRHGNLCLLNGYQRSLSSPNLGVTHSVKKAPA